MFFKQIWRNSSKNRKENGLFFVSLIIAIVAFYTLLSLESQDVMRFLKTMESDAVSKLMLLIPVVYLISLFFVFFLVYFACRYQMNQRRREFGLYLMLGMKRSRLFAQLMCETLWNSLLSLLIGLPVSLLLTEGISLATSKLVGIGIIGHRLSFSVTALLWTVAGFLAVQLLSMLLICLQYGRTQPAEFLASDAPVKQRLSSRFEQSLCFVSGVLCLAAAYYLGIRYLRNLDLTILAVLFLGITGTFLLYRGLGGFIGSLIRRKGSASTGLYTFTGRQLQENVFAEHKTLAISSLLLLMALSCISFGITMAYMRGSSSRSVDFSVNAQESELQTLLANPDFSSMIGTCYPMYLESMYFSADELDATGLIQALEALPPSPTSDELRYNIIDNAADLCDYIIAESSYNQLLASMGKKTLTLGEHDIALYTSWGNEGDFGTILRRVLRQKPEITLLGSTYTLQPDLYDDNVVADRSITLYGALIVPDALYQSLMTWKETTSESSAASDNTPFCWNIRLSDTMIKELGLMQAIQKLEPLLSASGLTYDSYLGSIGRSLFYTVAASYLTIYLGVLFFIIANTVISLKYMIQQRKNAKRYITLLMLGAETEELCSSSKKQIRSFFMLVLIVALCNSAAAVTAMFTSYARLPAGTPLSAIAITAASVLALFGLAELVYITLVQRTSCRELRSLQITDRG